MASGQVENQAGVVRRRFFVPRPKFKSYAELNAWLEDRCAAWAKSHPHQELRDRTIWEVFEDERASLVPYVGPFDGFHAVPASVSKTCLVRFDKNRYSVDGRAVGRPVEIRAYAERVEFWQDGKIVGRHERAFGRDKAIYDPLHYIPVLARKPPLAHARMRCRAAGRPQEWGSLQGRGAAISDQAHSAQTGQGAQWRPASSRDIAAQCPAGQWMVQILSMIPTDGLDAVDAACAEALNEGGPAASVVINILARHREPPLTIDTPDASRWMRASGTTSQLKLYGMKAAYDETIAKAVKRQHEPQQIIHCPAGACAACCREGAIC